MDIRNSQPSRYYEITSDPNAQFWVMNLLGWMGISLVTYLSLSLPYDQFEFAYLAHNFTQSVLGLMLSLPLRYVFRAIWGWSVLPRLAVGLGSVLGISVIWSFVRLLLFMGMTGERGLLADFGGWLFPSIFVFLTWAALYHGVKYHQLLQREHESLIKLESSQRQEALMRSQAESSAREAQLRLLRYQLNPHFLFNTLNSITSLVNAGRSDDAKQMLVRLSAFLRYSLDSDQAMMVTLNQEIEAANLYLRIEQSRFVDRLRLEIDIDPDIGGVSVPSFLLQPLLENSIKYAIARSEDGGTIRISANRAGGEGGAHGDEQLLICVEDSGNGERSDLTLDLEFEPGSRDQRTGIGLSNTMARLETLYGERFSLDAASSSLGGAKIEIRLPLNI